MHGVPRLNGENEIINSTVYDSTYVKIGFLTELRV